MFYTDVETRLAKLHPGKVCCVNEASGTRDDGEYGDVWDVLVWDTASDAENDDGYRAIERYHWDREGHGFPANGDLLAVDSDGLRLL